MDEITFEISRDEKSGHLIACWDPPDGSGGITTQGEDFARFASANRQRCGDSSATCRSNATRRFSTKSTNSQTLMGESHTSLPSLSRARLTLAESLPAAS
jgi:hypothetical protein